MKRITILFLLWTIILAMPAGQAGAVEKGPAPLVIQGAMAAEVDQLAARLDQATRTEIGPFVFWQGTIDGYPVIVSKTLMGVSNAAAATMLAIEKFHPIAVINQGTAGGHIPSLHRYDIVIGLKTFNGNVMMSGVKKTGEGSNPLEWRPMDWLGQNVAGEEAVAFRVRMFESDPTLVAAARNAIPAYSRGRIVEGISTSGDVWNNELDRIRWFHGHFGSTSEEAEAASSAQICSLFNVPYLSIRVISNNITTGEKFDVTTAAGCQEYVYAVARGIIQGLK